MGKKGKGKGKGEGREGRGKKGKIKFTSCPWSVVLSEYSGFLHR
jgi:hypothetical protein